MYAPEYTGLGQSLAQPAPDKARPCVVVQNAQTHANARIHTHNPKALNPDPPRSTMAHKHEHQAQRQLPVSHITSARSRAHECVCVCVCACVNARAKCAVAGSPCSQMQVRGKSRGGSGGSNRHPGCGGGKKPCTQPYTQFGVATKKKKKSDKSFEGEDKRK